MGQKRPLLPRSVWSIRVKIVMAGNACDIALFNIAVLSKLRGCDRVVLPIRDVISPGPIRERASMIQNKTRKPVRFGIAETTPQTLKRSLRRTTAAQIYKTTGNPRAVQLLLGHTKMDSTLRDFGLDVEDALTLTDGIALWPIAAPTFAAKVCAAATHLMADIRDAYRRAMIQLL